MILRSFTPGNDTEVVPYTYSDAHVVVNGVPAVQP